MLSDTHASRPVPDITSNAQHIGKTATTQTRARKQQRFRSLRMHEKQSLHEKIWECKELKATNDTNFACNKLECIKPNCV